ncbi:MAG TPA: hypothetical protein PKJ43_09205 [Prolixibacteraceae bacterium]|nr:hypothetical protein [Prolixibacteraceae bacterium]
MKKVILLSLLFIAAVAVKAQEPVFVKGDKAVNVGIGFDNYLNLSLSGEMGIMDGIADKGTIGAGVYAGAGTYLLHSSWYANHYRAMAGVRGTFHYPIIEKLDTYAGIGVGLEYWSYKYNSSYWGYDDYSYNGVDLDAGFFIGARYPLTQKFTVFGELGYGIGYLTAGISFKF